ncbi:hypothetical protein B0H16DRAFT_1478321 [Mycena metata]|uniref:Uncharacterized protein n=1 Tax=Mycena metata TaxID=1033252 RepID=A0AAD7H875_9AGAR|nr:hypothetical protein B0H16DRAFT_1478321 [Mycena metata]
MESDTSHTLVPLNIPFTSTTLVAGEDLNGNMVQSDPSGTRVYDVARPPKPSTPQVCFSTDETLKVARRLQSAKKHGLPCFWGPREILDKSTTPDGVMRALMFGYIIRQYDTGSGVRARYIEVAVPHASYPTRASRYMQQAFAIQHRRLKRWLDGKDETPDRCHTTGHKEPYGDVIKAKMSRSCSGADNMVWLGPQSGGMHRANIKEQHCNGYIGSTAGVWGERWFPPVYDIAGMP